MQIVIDIDEETYNEIKKIVADGNEMCFMQTLIANGTPLPKGHGRLIDAEVFSHNVVKYSHQSTKTIGQALADTPSIIKTDRSENDT